MVGSLCRCEQFQVEGEGCQAGPAGWLPAHHFISSHLHAGHSPQEYEQSAEDIFDLLGNPKDKDLIPIGIDAQEAVGLANDAIERRHIGLHAPRARPWNAQYLVRIAVRFNLLLANTFFSSPGGQQTCLYD